MRLLQFLCFLLGSSLFLAAEPLQCPPPDHVLSLDKGEYVMQAGVVIQLQSISIKLLPRSRRAPLCYLKTSVIEHGDVFIASESLSNLFNQKLKQKDSTVSEVQMEFKDDGVKISGKMKKLIAIPFSVEGPLTTDGTNLLIQAKSIKAMGLPVSGLLQALGKHLQSLMGSDSANGVVVSNNTIVFQLNEVAHVKGHIASATPTFKGLALRFTLPQQKK